MTTAPAQTIDEPVRVDATDAPAGAPAAAPTDAASGDAPVGAAGLTADDLGQLVGAFNEVTARLQESHDQLRTEVSRLNGELRDTRERLQRSRRLAELGEMAAGIAHELRNPLASIGLYARLLEQDLPSEAETGRNATRITSAVRRMDAIVTDVLAFAREERMRAEPIEVGALLRSAVDAGIEVAATLDVAPGVVADSPDVGVPSSVCCDPTLMHQALANIVVNAVQASAESGCAEPDAVVCGAAVRRELNADGTRAEMLGLWVRDRGPGLPPEVLRRMFNPFFTTRAAGTGLGLAIVHRIVDAHGGRVRASDNDGPGATVELLLPIGSERNDTAAARDGVRDDALGRTEASE